MPWYVLGVSTLRHVDIGGTMWLVYIHVHLRVEERLDPLGLAGVQQVFLMVFLSACSGAHAMTGAEWIQTRFGKGKAAQPCAL